MVCEVCGVVWRGVHVHVHACAHVYKCCPSSGKIEKNFLYIGNGTVDMYFNMFINKPESAFLSGSIKNGGVMIQENIVLLILGLPLIYIQ